MLNKFGFRREKDKEFKHIAHGLVPAASIAPKPAVPRTPPPRSPHPSPERPRSAIAAVILSSSLTGQTWAIPPARPRSFSESGQSESFISGPHIRTALYARDRWSDDLASDPHSYSPEHSEEDLEDKEEELENEEDREEHVYQTLDRQESRSVAETVYTLPMKPLKTSLTQLHQKPGRREFPPDFDEETSIHCPKDSSDSRKRPSVRKKSGSQKGHMSSMPPTLTTDHPCQLCVQPEKNAKMADEQKLLEDRLQHLEREISYKQASSNLRSSADAGGQTEQQNLKQHTQELVDENDALKLTVHRLNVELSRYQTCFRPLSKQEMSNISGLPKTGSPPPWLLDMKYLSPLLLAYEDRMNEKDALLQTTEEEVKRLRAHVEEVIKENERLHDEIAKTRGYSQMDCHQLQQQAFLVLQENQVLLDQLEAQHVKAKASQSKHHSEVSRVVKQLMLLEAEKQSLDEELEKSREEARKNARELQVLQARLKDAVPWDEHCNITGKLRCELEQKESKTTSEMAAFLHRLSSLQEENRKLAWDKSNLAAHLKRTESELEHTKQANRKAERRLSVLKRQKDECAFKEENTLHHMEAVLSVVEHISTERDQLLQMASVLQQEKQGFIKGIANGTAQFEKLEKEIKVYHRQASTRLAMLEEAAEGRSAAYQREILHLQTLLRERQEAEERLLQSKREIEEELEMVWQAATRENQQMKATLLDSKVNANLHSWCSDEAVISPKHQPHGSEPLVFTSNQSPGLQKRAVLKSDDQNNALDETHKSSLDFYC